MKFLLTNDDGYDAEGINVLRRAVNGETVTVAPLEHQSGCSHRVTMYGEHLEVTEKFLDVHAVDGRTADCTRIGLKHLAEDADWVLSGVNFGGNMGHDIYLSGTVAGAREAVFLGKPAISFSQFLRPKMTFTWERTEAWTRRVLDFILAEEPEPHTFWNVNFPHLEADAPEPELIKCEPCKQSLPVAYRVDGNRFTYAGVYSERLRDPGKDADVCFSGNIAVSKLSI
ncbi:MAG: 5'/3'-nucleotidase SurE [Candidatus Hydrogenedentota bacterium]